MTVPFTIDVRYYRLSEPFSRYFTALYLTTIECPPGEVVTDCVHPEWAALRFTEGPPPVASVGGGEMVPQWPFTANGPTSQAIRFSVARSRVWGLGLQPVGWSKFVDEPANKLTDRTVDGSVHPAFALFAPILDIIATANSDGEKVAKKINHFLIRYKQRPVPNEARILACQEALRDPDMRSVAELGDSLAMRPRSLERLCSRYFGFPPKLLLRRQRFLRSLARFMEDPRRRWSKSLDRQYYDQAQFVHDFKSFMGMTPSKYADAPHPILDKMFAQRMADQGAGPRS